MATERRDPFLSGFSRKKGVPPLGRDQVYAKYQSSNATSVGMTLIRSMRFAIISNSFPPDGLGGAERTAWVQAEGLAKEGHEVKVWAVGAAVGGRGSGVGIRPSTTDPRQPMPIVRFPSRFSDFSHMTFVSRFFFHLLVDAFARKDVVTDVMTWKPDILLTHNLVGCGMGTARAIQKRGVTWAHTLHDIQLTDTFGQETVAWSATRIARIHRTLCSAHRRIFFGSPDVVVSPTKWLMNWHLAHGFFKNAKTAVIPNPIEIGAPRERHLNMPATIVYVGRLTRDKGFDVFLDAIKRLPVSLVGRIVAIGRGGLMANAERLHDRRLGMRGAVSFEDAHRAIANADLLVAPSQILENQQTVLLQAMAEGTPAVATDVGGTRETLAGTGCPVVPSGDAMALKQAITELLSSQEQWQDTSRVMRSHAGRHEREKYLVSLLRIL